MYDFGYSWPWTYGHLVPAALFALAGFFAWKLKWRRWTLALFILLTLWSLAGLAIVQGPFRINRPLVLPTQSFLPSGGRVLDAGAGSGRSALMVLLARPNSRVVALDLFNAEYIDDSLGRLRENARIAGVDQRLETQTGDMRAMPLPDASFDAAVSAYAIDHLRSADIDKGLAEVVRVLRPKGQFLLMTMDRDVWMRVAYPLFFAHTYYGRTAAAERWRQRFAKAGLDVVEEGAAPGTLYILCRKR